MANIVSIKTVSEIHELLGRDKPVHPLISISHFENKTDNCSTLKGEKYAIDLYHVALIEGNGCSLGYGRSSYDFQEGSLIFTKPGQVLFSNSSNNTTKDKKGWSLYFHPDLIRKTELGKKMDEYTFFSYEVNEALHLSDKEKNFITNIIHTIKEEYSQNIDRHSHELITTNLKLLLDYSKRYYDRQFYTRTILNKDIVSRFEHFLKGYYNDNKQLEFGIPTVKYCGTELQMSPNYLSDLLKKETGRNAQDLIHFFVIERAKDQLLSSSKSISQIAYDLGFEYPPHFSRVFKSKTGMSPRTYIERSSMN